MRSFKQSRQALSESASIISVIVDALNSRIEQSELVVSQVQMELGDLKTRSSGLEWEQASLRSSNLQLLQALEELLANNKRVIADFEHLRTKVVSTRAVRPTVEPSTKPIGGAGLIGENDIMASLTPTEHETLEILRQEGPQAAPELGKRLRKSREHTSRLMKKLYLEGYVDRETNRTPFRYRLTERVRTVVNPSNEGLTAKPQEKA